MSLADLFKKREFWLYCDGSASTHGQRTGSYACHILEGNDNNRKELVTGASNHTTNNRQELLAICAGLQRVAELCDWILHGVTSGIAVLQGRSRPQIKRPLPQGGIPAAEIKRVNGC